ncbi:hypothetical protein NL529_27715, partial [Klebsiella pneumoniae]|nr:hypothetical protein [Klebsiella pneumoniae]
DRERFRGFAPGVVTLALAHAMRRRFQPRRKLSNPVTGLRAWRGKTMALKQASPGAAAISEFYRFVMELMDRAGADKPGSLFPFP